MPSTNKFLKWKLFFLDYFLPSVLSGCMIWLTILTFILLGSKKEKTENGQILARSRMLKIKTSISLMEKVIYWIAVLKIQFFGWQNFVVKHGNWLDLELSIFSRQDLEFKIINSPNLEQKKKISSSQYLAGLTLNVQILAD